MIRETVGASGGYIPTSSGPFLSRAAIMSRPTFFIGRCGSKKTFLKVVGTSEKIISRFAGGEEMGLFDQHEVKMQDGNSFTGIAE